MLNTRSTTAFFLFLFGLSVTIRAAEHPVPLEKNTDTAKCVECHEDKSKGKHVHSAMGAGCNSCHEIKVQGEVTNVDLNQPADQLCFSCHTNPAKEDDTQHGPYKAGQCVMCHDAHASDNPNQLIATGNDLCLECHIYRGRVTRKIKLFNKFDQTDEQYENIPKIELDPSHKFGHPFRGHYVAGKEDFNFKGSQMSCRSCHEYHVADNEKFVRHGVVSGRDICSSCHDENDRQSIAKRNERAAQEAEKAKK